MSQNSILKQSRCRVLIWINEITNHGNIIKIFIGYPRQQNFLSIATIYESFQQQSSHNYSGIMWSYTYVRNIYNALITVLLRSTGTHLYITTQLQKQIESLHLFSILDSWEWGVDLWDSIQGHTGKQIRHFGVCHFSATRIWGHPVILREHSDLLL